MSILTKLKELCESRKLFLLEPAVRSDPWVRWMYVSADIDAVVREPFPETFYGMRDATLRQTLDAFTTGEFIKVCEDPDGKPSDTLLARVHPVKEEFWQIRCTSLPPGMRVLGAFAAKDVFVGLYHDYREDMNFNQDVQTCRESWNDLFPEHTPFAGDNLGHYLSGDYDVQ